MVGKSVLKSWFGFGSLIKIPKRFPLFIFLYFKISDFDSLIKESVPLRFSVKKNFLLNTITPCSTPILFKS